MLLRKSLELNYQNKVDDSLVNTNVYKSGLQLRETFKSNRIKILTATLTYFDINAYLEINFE